VDADLVIRNGLVVDGTGAPGRVADVAIAGDRIVAVAPSWDGTAHRTIDATDRVVTPGFVDVHTHLDAQLAWDPLPTSSCWHGVTSAVLGNCGVTFAPVRPGQREFLAEVMESVEDIPRAAILDGLPWDWQGYGDYLRWLDRIPKGINVGGMVGHVALRVAAMDEQAFADGPVSAEHRAEMCRLLDEAMAAGALGVSTSRTYMHVVPDGRQVPGTFALDDEVLAFADVLGRHGRGLFEGAMRLGERDAADLPNTRAEVALMGEISRRSGRPVSFGLTQSDRRPDLFRRVVEFCKSENANRADVHPQTTARGVGGLFGLANRTPWDGLPAWKELQRLPLAERLAAIRNPERRAALVADANAVAPRIEPQRMFLLPAGPARYDCRAEDSLAAHAQRRGTTPVEVFLDAMDASDGAAVVNVPFLNQRLEAVEEMLDERVVTLGLADAGAHVGQIMDTSQPTFFLSYWVRERQRWTLEEAVRRLTSDTADLFGVKDRGRVAAGSFADVNVIDLESLTLHQPEFVHDFPNGAGRYVQKAGGYDATIVNGSVFMERGEHTGALAGRTVRSTD
jgi:N-acyl-D-aspartate/D-glutamate deacylase